MTPGFLFRSYAGRLCPSWTFDLTVSVKGDTEVDSHHTIEDTGIVLGHAIAEALGDKAGMKRYGYFILPMDETLALGAVDLSGRPYLNFQAEFTVPSLGTMDTEMVREFFYAVSYSAAMNLHLKILDAGNNHHMAEALFKAFGRLWIWQYPKSHGLLKYGPQKAVCRLIFESRPLKGDKGVTRT